MKKEKTVRIPKQERSIDKRDRIIDAAKDLFINKGYENTNTKEISEQAGISIGTFYCYFKDKKSLIIEIIRIYKKQVIDDILIKAHKAGVGMNTPAELIPVLIHSVIDALFSIPQELFRYALAMRFTDPEIEQLHHIEDQVTLQILSSFRQVFDKGTSAETFDVAAKMVLHTIKEVVNAYIMFKPEIPYELFVKELTDMISAYLSFKGLIAER